MKCPRTGQSPCNCHLLEKKTFEIAIAHICPDCKPKDDSWWEANLPHLKCMDEQLATYDPNDAKSLAAFKTAHQVCENKGHVFLTNPRER